MINSAASHLTGLVIEVDKTTLSKIQKEYGDRTTAFKFSNKFQSLILSYREETDEFGGRVLGVATTGSKLTLFDQVKHGYNGQMQLNEEDEISSSKSIHLSKATDVVVAFQYNGEEAEFIQDGTSSFTRIILVGL